MKHLLLTIGSFFSSMLFVQSQTLYGTTFYGGSAQGGILNQFVVGPNNLSIAKSFETFARRPQYTNLIQANDGKLYGMTSEGGGFNAGVIFSYDPISSSFLKLKDFDITNGGSPYGSLMQAADGNLYGMTTYGGNNNRGVIFSYDPGSATYEKLLDFDSSNGSNPSGSLLQASSGKLYGITGIGGSNNVGVLFSYDITLSSYAKLKDFDNVSGDSPFGSLIQARDGKLYGTASMGGTTNNGVVFSFDPGTSIYQALYDFDLVNGANPTGNLVEASDGILYGMMGMGGSSGYGGIFSYDPNSLNYTKVADFDGSSGYAPSGGLIQANDGKLYGMTAGGGANFIQTGVIFSFDPSSATYSMLYSFDYPNGGRPYGILLQADDGKLYGLTSVDGDGRDISIESGVIFSFDPITITYTALKHVGGNQDGTNPSATLIRGKDGKVYGTTAFGGNNGVGVIFTYDPSTSTYNKVKDLDYGGGSHPFGSLTQASDGKFYGMTAFGGVSADREFFDRWGDLGVIFSFDPTTLIYSNLMDLTANGGYLGGHPYGSLVQADDGKLYGMTSGNGGGYRASGSGIIFSFDPSLFVPSKLKDFANFDPSDNFLDNLNGGNPYGSFLKGSDGKLYGMTSEGGNNNDGVIFSYEPGSDTYTKLVDLDDANGSHPYGTLIQARDDKLYGMTYDGGSNNAGVIFSFDLLTSTYTKLIDLDDNDGSNPYGSLIQASDGKFYGMTSGGGDHDLGVIFSFDPITSSYDKLIDYDGSNGATPYIGSAFIELAALSPLPVTLISFSGQNNGSMNELSWKNSGEYSLSYYQVERSVDGRNFDYIFRVKAIGAVDYSYDDNIARVQSGVYFYRLKMVDLDGNFTYSNVIRITVKNDLIVFVNPNPFKNTFKVILNSANSDNAILALTDLNGRQLYKTSRPIFPGDNTIEITKVGNLPNGTYMLTVITSNKTQIFKIVKSD